MRETRRLTVRRGHHSQIEGEAGGDSSGANRVGWPGRAPLDDSTAIKNYKKPILRAISHGVYFNNQYPA